MGFQVHGGGKGADQAVAVARLAYPARMIGRLGNDHFGAIFAAAAAAISVTRVGAQPSMPPCLKSKDFCKATLSQVNRIGSINLTVSSIGDWITSGGYQQRHQGKGAKLPT